MYMVTAYMLSFQNCAGIDTLLCNRQRHARQAKGVSHVNMPKGMKRHQEQVTYCPEGLHHHLQLSSNNPKWSKMGSKGDKEATVHQDLGLHSLESLLFYSRRSITQMVIRGKEATDHQELGFYSLERLLICQIPC